MTAYLGPQKFLVDINATEVFVHRNRVQPWDCVRDAAEIQAQWGKKVVFFHRKTICSGGVESIYENLAASGSRLIVKLSPYNPPGMFHFMSSSWVRTAIDTGMIFTQVFDQDVAKILDTMDRAEKTGRTEDYRLILFPDDNRWAGKYASASWIIPIRVVFPSVALLTALRAGRSLWQLSITRGSLRDIDVVHLTLALEFVRNLLVAFFLAEGMSGGQWVPWNVMAMFLMGLPGMGLVSWVLVALKWREVRHATRRNRPIRNMLRAFPKMITMVAVLLIGIDCRIAWDRYYWVATHGLMQLGYDTYGVIGSAVCSYLLVQGGKVLYSLRTGRFIVREVDADLVTTFWTMTAWMMFGAICSSVFIGIVSFQVLVGLQWFWTLPNYFNYFIIVYCSLMLTSFAYVMSLTPLATTGGAVMDRFGKWLTMFDAATCAALLGDHATVNAGKLIQEGVKSIRGIRLSELTKEDLQSNRSELTPEGHFSHTGVDWFISHSWHDDADSKWEMLHLLAQSFQSEHGREPVLWIDKFCIDQRNIAESLTYLPIYLLLCKRMVVLAGSTYTSRLWCNWELFMVYGICSQPMIEVDFVPVGGFSLEDLADNLEEFDMSEAQCFLESDKTSMLEVIDKSGKGRDGFNQTIRNLAKMVHDNVKRMGRRSTRRLRRTTFFQTASRAEIVELTIRSTIGSNSGEFGHARTDQPRREPNSFEAEDGTLPRWAMFRRVFSNPH